MNELTHLITDIITIVILVLIALGYILSFIIRYRVEKKYEELYFSLYLITISLFLLFDNTVIDYYFTNQVDINVNVPIVTFLCYLMYVVSTSYLMEVVSFKSKDKKFIFYSYLVLLICPVISIFTILWGVEWYGFFVAFPVLLCFILCGVIDLIYIGYQIKKSRSFSSIKILYSYLGVVSVSIYIITTKFYLEMTKENYNTPNYYTILVPIFIFIYLMAKDKNDEYLELVELRKLEINKNQIDMELFDTNYKLSKKELLIAKGLCEGKLYKEISSDTEISISYVKKLVNSLYKKCEVANRSELINLGYSLKK